MLNALSDKDKGNILIVDDQPENLRLLRDTLGEQGYKVRSSTKAITALRGAKAILPDLILLDIKMPDLDGYEICRRLKADPETADIPVIFLSALNETIDKVRAFSVGGIDFITKPFQIEEVLIRVETHLTIKRLQKNLYQQNQRLLLEIEERKRIEQELFAEKELAQVTLQSIGDAVIITDAFSNIKSINPVAEQLTGWNNEEAQGLPLSEVFKIVHELTRQPQVNPIEEALQKQEIVDLADSTILITRTGTEYAIIDSAAPIRDRQGQIVGAVMVFYDTTENRNLTRQLFWQANHDTLTGLYNRQALEQKLREMIANRQPFEQHALCYMDLDQFKVINDTSGHIAGDELLRQVTALLQTRIRSRDILARLGGDEFGLLLYHCPLDKAIQLAQTLRTLIQDFRFSWNNKIFNIGVSIGVVAIDETTQDLTTVMSAADAACYVAKEKGRNCIHVYRLDDTNLLEQRNERQWVTRLNQALEENRFCLYWQKIIPIAADVTTHFYEILLRLVEENDQVITPGAFIPAAERYDLMPILDRWVINTFFERYETYYFQQKQQNSDWQDLKTYCLNLSGASINNESFLTFLKEKLTQSPIPHECICFEITETAAIANLYRATEFIMSIKEFGCRFSLDDFGSGMSSLNYLKNLPVDYLKIDGTFVKNLTDNPVDLAIVECFNRISEVIGIKTIAEFVENQDILNILQEIGIHYAQGYEIDRPHPMVFEAIDNS